MTLPKTLRIGAYTYEVRSKKTPYAYGRTRNSKARIEIDPAQDASNARDTLLHEAIHAIIHCSGGSKLLDIPDGDYEEKLARLLAPWLLGLLRDNPDLVMYLLASE